MHAQLEFKLPNETEIRRAMLHPYSIKDASPYLDENKGAAYFVPHGYQPILVPQNDEDATIQALLDLAVPTVQAVKVPIPLRQTLLPHYIIKPCKKSKTVKPVRPPRPPNAFILYRQNQQAHVLRQNSNLCNNDVSRIIGSMWNGESPLIKQRFHLLAQKMKEQHRAMYPMYRYSPRKASKRKKKVKTKHPLQEQLAPQMMQQEMQLAVSTIIQPPQWDHNIQTEDALLNTHNLALGTTALDINEFTTPPLWI
ncbi:hypothetical protein PMAC_001419 [Pneumocystis sp. 'macacae']|nr:hypothetical protein PMAC_001419 [Pneumocystis sp. 'macacae']